MYHGSCIFQSRNFQSGIFRSRIFRSCVLIMKFWSCIFSPTFSSTVMSSFICRDHWFHVFRPRIFRSRIFTPLPYIWNVPQCYWRDDRLFGPQKFNTAQHDVLCCFLCQRPASRSTECRASGCGTRLTKVPQFLRDLFC